MRFDVAQNCLFHPLLRQLSGAGVNTQLLLKRSGLAGFKTDNPDFYIPVTGYYKLLREIKKLGVEDFIGEFNTVQQVSTLSAYGENFHLTPNLLEASKFTEKYNHILLSNEIIKLEIRGVKAHCTIDYLGKYDETWQELEALTLCQVIHGMRLATGENWSPDEVHLRSEKLPKLDKIFKGPNFPKVFLGRPRTIIVLPTRLLSNRINTGAHEKSFDPSLDTSGIKLEKILDSAEYIPSIWKMAEYFNMSISSLKRALAHEDRTYFEVIDNWRFKKALILLNNSNLRIKDIAEQLKFANSSNFSRTFKRWVNEYPESYREMLK